ncbi:hypothetical protein [Legionella spiritensis]|uniref:Uncharacterized protein n=1 Tax=Legionella spiritensis TaxID=452 RepID=A0A0W0ZAZ1_LEGSP|nr:hypothetical protein [Legionella spiritensis]KTD66288.1 hypothetical protein Lspi_0051 [Legionella spiritensis]SNV48490.1 Uncharacterised protein [Legionella spiritensis]VEG91499.1 Uncharacterised protein [Legionella spiritensis]
MEHVQEQDLIKIKELLRHTGEFIAYFELAEAKMTEWRQDIEQQTKLQEQRAQQQLQALHHELESLQDVLTQAGLARLRLSAEQALKQGEEHMALLQKTSRQILHDLNTQHGEFTQMVEKSVAQIEQHADRAITRIDEQLAAYDIQHFRRVASESCEIVEKTATQAIAKSAGYLKAFQWRSISLALLTTILTAFAIGLYVSNEMPWEIHQHAMSEREAGKILMKAWPGLTQQEKDKILNHQKLKYS